MIIPVVGLLPEQEHIQIALGDKFYTRGLTGDWTLYVSSASTFSINTYYDNCTFALSDQEGNILTDNLGNPLFASDQEKFQEILKEQKWQSEINKVVSDKIKWYSLAEGIEKSAIEKKYLLVSINDPNRLNINNKAQRLCAENRDDLIKDYSRRNEKTNKIIPVVIDVSKTLTREENNLISKLKFYTGKIIFRSNTNATAEYKISENTIVSIKKSGKAEFRTASDAILRLNTKEVIVPVVEVFPGQEDLSQISPGDGVLIETPWVGVEHAEVVSPFIIKSFYDNCTFALVDQSGNIAVNKLGIPLLSNNIYTFKQLLMQYDNY